MFYKQNRRILLRALFGVLFALFVFGVLLSIRMLYVFVVLLVFVGFFMWLVTKVNQNLETTTEQAKIHQQSQTSQLDLVTQQLYTLITYLPYPMILVNQQGIIELANKSFEMLLVKPNTEQLSITSQHIPFVLRRLLNDSYLNEEPKTQTISINTFDYQCLSIPVVQQERYKGSLFVLVDVTKLLYQERVQKRFVADASHELKTPITAIKGMVEILLRPEFNDETTLREFLEQISVENDRLETIVNDLLYLSKLNSKTILLNKQPLDVSSVVAESLRTFKVQIQQKNIQVEVNSSSKTPLLADAQALLTILNNIINNVCMYSEASKLVIDIYDNQKDKLITIQDDGVGIQEEELDRVFERFYRIDGARNRKTGGSGLGLSIVKELVEAHGASIFVESKINEYTMFTLVFKS